MDIYYRAKETSTNNFVYGTPMCDTGDDDWWYMPLRGGDVPIDSNTIGMFTGSIDKNSVYIFDGDIVAIPSATSDRVCRFVVLYNNANQAFMYHRIMGNTNTYSEYGTYFGELRSSLEFCCDDLCVVGNIFDNPVSPCR